MCTSRVVCMALRAGERPKWTAGRSERFELGGTSRQNKCAHTPKMHTVQNKLAAQKKKKGSWGVVISFITLCAIQLFEITHWKNLFSILLLMIKDCPTLTFEAASKHTNPMLKSIVSPIRWLSIIQAYVLHYRKGEQDVTHKCYTRTQKPLMLCWKCHRTIINLCTKTSELELRARLKSSQFPARCLLFRCGPVSSPPPGKWPSEKPFPRSAARTPAPRWRTCPPRSPSERWSSASSCPEGHYPKITQYDCHADQVQMGRVTWR